MSTEDSLRENRRHLDSIRLGKIRAASSMSRLKGFEDVISHNVASSLETAQLILARRVMAGLPQFPVRLLPKFVLGNNVTCTCHNEDELSEALLSKLFLSPVGIVQFIFED